MISSKSGDQENPKARTKQNKKGNGNNYSNTKELNQEPRGTSCPGTTQNVTDMSLETYVVEKAAHFRMLSQSID